MQKSCKQTNEEGEVCLETSEVAEMSKKGKVATWKEQVKGEERGVDRQTTGIKQKKHNPNKTRRNLLFLV